MKSQCLTFLALLLCLSPVSAQPAESHALGATSGIPWSSWDVAFARAQADNRMVLLNLGAVWCHWCHVMEETTYQDPKVVALLKKHFVTVQVDQDARPDLSKRYQDYGWPATILFDSQGRELARLSGYQTPEEMTSILQRLINDPKPLADETPATQGSGTLSFDLVDSLKRRHYRLYDDERGGWGHIHKFVNPPVVEYSLTESLRGSTRDKTMARTTLTKNLALIDPEFGGVYQYSDSGRWDSLHYEKIMSAQAGNLIDYSLAYAQFDDQDFLIAAHRIADYLLTFLRSSEGAFYVSQDADLVPGQKAHDYFAKSAKARKKLGIPRIDTHLYARENGMAIEALAVYAGVSQRSEILEAALQAAQWVLANRKNEDGSFRHGEDSQGLYLGDTLACGRAFLALYQATSDPVWLKRATQCADVIEKRFTRPEVDGVLTSITGDVRSRDENVSAARFANLLYQYTGQPSYRTLAAKALAYFAIDGVTDQYNPGGLLLALDEFERPPTHIVIVGPKGDAQAEKLFEAAQRSPIRNLRLDRWCPGTPLPPYTQASYPETPVAAYACAGTRCSAPITSVKELTTWLARP